ncbi:OmpA family protein [Flavobacterium davisii]|uniref:OmpA family protein n=1 Tax=Flavobacterium davisii TaxID=2906077 RepID=UPI0021649953|nr:OmpA family protein [Flavobacterium davisii]
MYRCTGTIKNNGCPEVTQAVVKKLNDYAKTILFDAGKNTFQSTTYPVLEAMSALLKEYPTAKFSLEGHTDSIGKAETNQALSEARASAIMNYLVSKGIDKARLKAIGYGESKPIASNKTKAGKALNRRVEVRLIIE